MTKVQAASRDRWMMCMSSVALREQCNGVCVISQGLWIDSSAKT